MPMRPQLALGLAHQAALLGAVEAQHRRRDAVLAAQVRAERDVLEHRHRGDHLHVLERARRRRAARSRATAAHRCARPSRRDLAARRRQHAGDEVEGGRLAGAVRADQAEDLAGPDLEADVVDRDQAAEFLAHRVARRARPRRAAAAAASGSGARVGPVDLAAARAAGAASTNAQMPSRAYCSTSTSRTPKTMIS